MCWNKLIINVLHQIGCHTGWRDTFTSAHSKFIGRESIMVEIDDERKIFLAWIILWMSSLSLSPCWFMSPRICMNNFFVCHFHHIKIFIILYYKLYHWHSIVAKMTTINAQCTCTLYSTPGWRWKRATTSSSHDNDVRLLRLFQLYTSNVEDCAKMSWLKNKICEIRVRQNVIHKISFYVL